MRAYACLAADIWRGRREIRTNASAYPALKPSFAAAAVFALLTIFTPQSYSNSPQNDPEANAPLKQLSLAQLGSVEVTTTSKEPETVWRTPAAIYVITQEDIRRSGATSIPEVLRLVPGVEVARIDSNQWAVGIRGFGSSFSKSVLVLIDGRSVYTPLFAGVYWDVQNVLLEDVERIEVIRGPAGTVWGANAVNGVINIITKSSKDTHGGLAAVSGGNVEQGSGRFHYGGGYRTNVNYRVYGMAFGRAPGFHSDRDNFDDWQVGQGGFRIDWDNQKRDTLTLQGDLYKGSVGQIVNIGYYSPPASINVVGSQDVSGGNILGRWRRTVDAGDIQVQAYYDRTYRLGPQLGETRNTFDVDFIHHLTFLPRQDFIWGVGARWSPSDLIQTVATVDFLPHHQSDNIYSAFLQDQIAIVRDKLQITIGSKFEHNIYTGWELQPSARLLWTPSVHQTIWGSISRAVSTPSRVDENLQLTGFTTIPVPIFFRIAGNPKFVSETLLGYEVGYRRLITPRLYLDVSLFHNNYNNLTSFGNFTLSVETNPSPAHLLLTVPWTNGILGNTNGGEISPDWKVSHWLELKASYSYVSLDLKNMPGNTDAGTLGLDQGSSPRHQVVVQSLFNLPKRFEFDPTYRYVSALPAQSVKSYSTMDLRFGWRFAGNVEASVVGQNLFQPNHMEFGFSPGPMVGVRRSVYGQITWHETR
ncbi:MAG TPA: TonB-dependent receptor [Candidatus Acidoferrum sp.]|nr:TonB-dependent receptor [Candidatus Acidoferrum sp.]